MICPTCKKPIKETDENRGAPSEARSSALPFCSARCRSADLGSWLNESYRVATATDDEDLEALLSMGDDERSSTN